MGGAFNTPGTPQNKMWTEIHKRAYGFPPNIPPRQVKAQIPATAPLAPIVKPSGPAVAPASGAKNATTEPVAAKGYSTPQAAIFPTVTVPQDIAPQPFVAPISKINQPTAINQVSSFKLPDTSNLRFGGS